MNATINNKQIKIINIWAGKIFSLSIFLQKSNLIYYILHFIDFVLQYHSVWYEKPHIKLT